jgi:transposase
MLNEAKNLLDLSFSKANFCVLKTEIIGLKNSLESAQQKIAWYEEQIKLGKQRQFGKKSETSESLQLPLFDTGEESEVEPQKGTETITYTRRKKTTGRKIDTSKLPRERCVHDLSDSEKQCSCGNQLECIGEDVSEQLEYIPAQIKVIEHIRPKYICRKCETIKSASKPETPIAKSMATASLLTEVIISKYEHHLPLYRRSKMFLQEGIDIPDNTLGNWVMQSGVILAPLGESLWKELNHVKVLQADETPVKVLDIDKKGYMWGYHSCDPKNRFVIFEYNESRSAEVVDNRLAKYKGILQTDGYQGYNGIRAKKEVINVGCWAHCRRKFADAVKVSKKTGKAHEAMSRIKKLYDIETKAKNLSFAERKELRQRKAKPILDKMHEWLQHSLNQAPPESALGKALTYTCNQWLYLYEYIKYGEVEIDNNWIENQIRPFALGRKNWLFVGNQKGANVAALLYGLIQTCKMNNINARTYLTYVLNQTGKLRRREVDARSLLPQFIDKNLLE